MVLADLQGIVQAVVDRARRQGYVVPREIREELTQGGIPEERWKEVITLARPQLSYQKGRYYFVPPIKVRIRRDHEQKLEINRAVRHLISRYKAAAIDVERRSHRRIHFNQPVNVITSDRREMHLMSQDISLTGIRLIGTCDLRGQRVHVQIPNTDKGSGQWCFAVHILWSSKVGDGLIECGGIFVERVSDESQLLKIVADE